MEAEDSASSVTSWPEVFDSYERFRHCDDGSIAEGYSESITRILDTHWGTIGSLHALSSDAGFREFVLRHIDLTAPSDRLSRIAEHARSACPQGLSELCAQIERLARGSGASSGLPPN